MINVNLLRPEKKEIAVGEKPVLVEEERERQLSIPAIIAAVAITLITIGLLYILQDLKIKNLRNDFENKTLQVQEKQNVLKEREEVLAIKNELEQKVKLISDLDLRRQDAVKMMDKVSGSLPDWVWLTALSIRGNQVTIDGKAMSNNLISDYITNLQSPGNPQNQVSFTNVQMISSNRKREGLTDVYQFKLVCQYVHQVVSEETNKGM